MSSAANVRSRRILIAGREMQRRPSLCSLLPRRGPEEVVCARPLSLVLYPTNSTPPPFPPRSRLAFAVISHDQNVRRPGGGHAHRETHRRLGREGSGWVGTSCSYFVVLPDNILKIMLERFKPCMSIHLQHKLFPVFIKKNELVSRTNQLPFSRDRNLEALPLASLPSDSDCRFIVIVTETAKLRLEHSHCIV